MRRPRRAAAAAAPLALLLLAACGSSEATQGSVRDDVRETLLERPDNELTGEEAGAVAECVASGMFEGDFSPDERNDATRASDGDQPNAELAAKVQALVDGCLADVEG
jgi:hypothetical protein